MKSKSKFLSLKIAGVLFLGAAMTIGVVKASSQNRVLPAEATTAYKPYGIVFDKGLVVSYKPNTADATSGSALDGKWTWSNSTGVTFSEDNFIYIQSSTMTAKGTYKHLKFTIQSGKTAQIAFHNNKEINLTGAGVEMYCDKELSMSVYDNIGEINISQNITGKTTRDTNEPGSAYVYGTTGSGSGVQSYCDTMYIDFTNNQSSTAVIYVCSVQVYVEDNAATYNLNGGHFPNAEYLNTIYCIAHNLYLSDYYDSSKIMTPTANPITIPVKEGYVFKGFYKEDTFENIFIDETGYLVDGIDHQFTSPFNLYAKWAPAGQPVTIAAGTGVSNVFLSTSDTATSGDPSGTSYPEGTTVYAYVDLKPGFKPVTGWGDPISGSIYKIPTSHVMTDQPYDFGTHGAAGKYTYNITYELDGGTLEEGNPATFDVETATFTLNNPTKEGYTFLGWTGSNGETPQTSVTIPLGSIGDRTYNANFSLNKYTITYNLNGGTVSGENPEEYSIESADFTLINPTKTGYTFKGWSGTGLDGDENLNVGISHLDTGDKEFTANWTRDEYSISYNLDGGTVETANPTTYNVETATFTLNNPTKTGCTFLGWSGTDIIDKSTSVTIEQGSVGDKSYTANWSVNNYKVTLNRNGAESGTPSVNVDYGSAMPDIQIPSLPNKTFIGYWDGNDISTCTQYYDAHGHSTHVWDKAEDSTIYAHYLTTLEVNEVTGTEHIYDGNEHSYESILVQYVEGTTTITLNEGEYTLKFSNDGGLTYTEDEKPTFTSVGDHTIYYQVSKEGFATLESTIVVTISEVDKTALNSLINTVDSYLDSISEKYPDIASTLKTIRDEAYNDFYLEKDVSESQVSEEIAKLEEALKNAKVDIVETLINSIGTVTFPDSKEEIEEARDAYDALDDELKPLVENYATLTTAETTYDTLASKRNDETSGVSIETKDGTAIDENINLRVEIRTSIKAEEGSTEYNNIQSKLAADEVISNVYDIKLVKNEGGVETIIQPSDIKEGMKIIVHIKLPTGLDVSGLKLLHIHGENDINFVENFETKDGEIVFEADRFSEIAFVKKASAPAPQPEPSNSDNKVSGWVIFAIVFGGILTLGLLFFLFFVILKRRKNKEEEDIK